MYLGAIATFLLTCGIKIEIPKDGRTYPKWTILQPHFVIWALGLIAFIAIIQLAFFFWG